MNKTTAFDIINRNKELFSLNNEFIEALDIALETLRSESEFEFVYFLQLQYGDIFYPYTLYFEEYYTYDDVLARIEELRKQVVAKCNDVTSEFEFLYKEHEGRMENATKDLSPWLLSFIFKGKICSFSVDSILPYRLDKSRLKLKRDTNIAKYVMSNVLKLA